METILTPPSFALVDALSEPQLHGAVVVAVISPVGGSGKTSIVNNIAKMCVQNNCPKRGLVIDPTFSDGLGDYFDIPPDSKHGLNALLVKIRELILDGRLGDQIDLPEHIRHIGAQIDILPSFSPISISHGLVYPTLEYFPLLLSSLRKIYDFILIDVPSRGVNNSLTFLTACNYLLIPYCFLHLRQQIPMIWRFDSLVTELNFRGYPIAIGGIIPWGYQIESTICPKILRILKRLFGQYVLSVIPDDEYSMQTARQCIDDRFDIGYLELYKRFCQIIAKRPHVRKGPTIELGRKMKQCVNGRCAKLGYKDVWEGVPDLSWNTNQIRECLRRVTIFGFNNLGYCIYLYLCAMREGNEGMSDIRDHLISIFESETLDEQEKWEVYNEYAESCGWSLSSIIERSAFEVLLKKNLIGVR